VNTKTKDSPPDEEVRRPDEVHLDSDLERIASNVEQDSLVDAVGPPNNNSSNNNHVAGDTFAPEQRAVEGASISKRNNLASTTTISSSSSSSEPRSLGSSALVGAEPNGPTNTTNTSFAENEEGPSSLSNNSSSNHSNKSDSAGDGGTSFSNHSNKNADPCNLLARRGPGTTTPAQQQENDPSELLTQGQGSSNNDDYDTWMDDMTATKKVAEDESSTTSRTTNVAGTTSTMTGWPPSPVPRENANNGLPFTLPTSPSTGPIAGGWNAAVANAHPNPTACFRGTTGEYIERNPGDGDLFTPKEQRKLDRLVERNNELRHLMSNPSIYPVHVVLELMS